MDLRWWAAMCAALLLLLTPQTFGRNEDCPKAEEGRKECLPKYNMSTYQGSKGSLNINYRYNEKKMIDVCKCNLQGSDCIKVLVGRPSNLHPVSNGTGVSLKNQIMTVMNATKAHEGIYRIISQISGECLAEVNQTILDIPPADVTPTSNMSLRPGSMASPSGSNDTASIADVTPTFNMNMSTSPASPYRKIDTASIADVTPTFNMNMSTSSASPSRKMAGIIIGTIAGAGIIACIIFYIIIRFKKNNSLHGYTAASQSASAVESELVMNGFGHHPKRSQLVSESIV